MNQKMMDCIHTHCLQGHSVFVDGMAPDMVNDFLRQTASHSVKLGLAYLPLHHLVDRVTKRNTTAGMSPNTSLIRSNP